MKTYNSENVINDFFTLKYEKLINRAMMEYSYSFPTEDVCSYLECVNAVSVGDFVAYVKDNCREVKLTTRDIVQFSSFDDATINVCKLMKEHDNPGYNAKALGGLLLDDGKTRNDIALTKYGENHGKTGVDLGLLVSLSSIYFLSCIGYVYNELSEIQKNKILVRLLFRNRLIEKILLQTLDGRIVDRDFFPMISDSTYKRRRSNIRKLLRLLNSCDEYDFSSVLEYCCLD